nr:S8 family serine peptidase [candidate division Zixibacteria bacterium]
MKKLHRLFYIFPILTLFLIGGQTVARGRDSNQTQSYLLKQRVTPVKPVSIKISPQADIAGVVVKFKEGSSVRLRDNAFISLKRRSVVELNSLLDKYKAGGNRISRLIEKSEEAVEKEKITCEMASGQRLADFNLYYRIDISSPSEAEEIVNSLNRLDIVEIAYAEPRAEVAEDIYPPTPDFVTFQDYRLAAPTGVDADYANTLTGGDGTGVKIMDIEISWNETHEDLEKALGGTIGQGNSQSGDHGTAVLGEMIAGDNGYGVTGICPGADIGMISVSTYGTDEAILMAADTLERGDLILIELHAPGPRYDFEYRPDQLGYVCMEYWQSVFDAIQYAWAKGIIVIEAAGNGAENFDDVLYGSLFDTTYRNSHAIMAGAGAPPSGNYGVDRSRLDFSNHGERVNLQGYGREVFTTGYGDYFDGSSDDPDQYYTSVFAGTSSASPIVTGTVACLQGYYMATYGVPLTADQALQVLNATGSAQQGDTTGQHIGPRPDLAAAIPVLTTPPSLFTDPIYLDTILEAGQTAIFPVWIHNRSGSYGLDFAVTGNDSLTKMSDWLTVTPESGSLPAADSLELTMTLDASMLEPRLDTYKGIIEINWGSSGGTLDSLTLVPVFLDIFCVDDTTFSVTSSGDPDGPVYDWIEIKDIGTLIPYDDFYNGSASNPLDDGTAGPIDLPFNFDFYGTDYDRIFIGVNGALSFTDSNVNKNGYYENLNIPGNEFGTLVAVFWNDLIIGDYSHGGGHGNIYYYHTPGNDSTIIEWYQVGNYNSPYDTLTTFQVILTSYGDISMQYLNPGNTGQEYTALIGISSEECAIEPYFDNGIPLENVVTALSAVCFTQSITPEMSGDCNGDGGINILDATYLLAYLYRGGSAPNPPEEGDVNCSGSTNILDVTYLISYLYKSGPAPCIYFL